LQSQVFTVTVASCSHLHFIASRYVSLSSFGFLYASSSRLGDLGLPGNFPADTAVTDKAAGRIKYWLTAYLQTLLDCAVGVASTEGEIEK
jgi:hypothetical protein